MCYISLQIGKYSRQYLFIYKVQCCEGVLFMAQSISNNVQSAGGSINRIGTTNNARVLYQIIDGNGGSAKISVAQKDCDTFERSYKDIMEAAPKLEEYARTTSTEKMMKKQQMSKWIMAGGAVLGGIYPLLKAKGNGFWGVLKQIGLTLLGTGVGLGVGTYAAVKLTTPPGAVKLSKATQTLSKLDIEPVYE